MRMLMKEKCEETNELNEPCVCQVKDEADHENRTQNGAVQIMNNCLHAFAYCSRTRIHFNNDVVLVVSIRLCIYPNELQLNFHITRTTHDTKV